MRIPRSYIRPFIHILAFTGWGLLTFLLLINLITISPVLEKVLASPWSYIFVIILFNLIGFVLLRMSNWINHSFHPYNFKSLRSILFYILAAILLFGINYGILIVIKLIVGSDDPTLLPNKGLRLLVMIWLEELVVMGLLVLNRSTLHTLELHKKATRFEEESNRAKYLALQNQLNPHFLFNSLNALVSEIEHNSDNAIRFTRKLSDVYRYVLQGQEQRFVSLADELDFLYSYIFLHQVRLGECITIDTDLPTNPNEIQIAPLSLQLLAENAIKHNIINEEYPMILSLKFSSDTGSLLFSNPLNPKLTTAPSGTGLRNLSNRYLLLCGRKIEIIQDNERKIFTVKIPLIYE